MMPKPVVEIDTVIRELNNWKDEIQGEFNDWEDKEEEEQDEETGEKLQDQIDRIDSVLDAIEEL
jgi:hypothetical protein